MDYRELVRNIFLAIVVGLASGVGRGFYAAPGAELLRRVEVLEEVCGSVPK